MNGEQVSKAQYDEYVSNGEIYDYVEMICKKFNLDVYEHGEGLKPMLLLNHDKTDFYSFTIDDFEMSNYNPMQPNLKLELGI